MFYPNSLVAGALTREIEGPGSGPPSPRAGLNLHLFCIPEQHSTALKLYPMSSLMSGSRKGGKGLWPHSSSTVWHVDSKVSGLTSLLTWAPAEATTLPNSRTGGGEYHCCFLPPLCPPSTESGRRRQGRDRQQQQHSPPGLHCCAKAVDPAGANKVSSEGSLTCITQLKGDGV